MPDRRSRYERCRHAQRPQAALDAGSVGRSHDHVGTRDPIATGGDRRIREHVGVEQAVTVDDVPAEVTGLMGAVEEVDLVAAFTEREPRGA